MSILKKNALAVALVAGLGIAGAAGAYTTWTAGNLAPEKVASSEAADDSVTMTEDVEIRVDPTDLIVGRTTGFQVRLNLFGGSSGSSSVFDAVLTPVAGDQLPVGWTVALAAGGQIGDNFAVINVEPPTSASIPGIVPGEIIQIPGTTLGSVEELLVDDGIISGQTFFADPVTATELAGSRKDVQLLQSGNPIILACDTSDGDVEKRIDVADTSDEGGYEAKTHFSPDGSLGGAVDPGDDLGTPYDDTTTFDFGNVSTTVDSAFPAFTYQGTDQFDMTVYGPAGSNFAAFDDIYLSNDNCATALESGTISGNEVTFDFTLADVGGGAAGYDLSLCGMVNGTTIIDDVNPVRVETTFTRPATDLTRTTTCSVLPLLYNGSVIEVYHINPAANPTAQTFLRIINRSGTSGTVTIDGIDDEGNGVDANGNPDGSNRVTFVLPAYESIQYNSDELENGAPTKKIPLNGAWGNGVGKWRAIVTAEFAGARVQGLSRNTIDDTVTNLTDADGQGEQVHHSAYDNGAVGP